jgi:hypothetical protein
MLGIALAFLQFAARRHHPQPRISTMAQPDFIAYSLVSTKDKNKDYWHRLGAAFKQAKSGGYNLQLNSLPLDGRIVLMPPKQDEA